MFDNVESFTDFVVRCAVRNFGQGSVQGEFVDLVGASARYYGEPSFIWGGSGDQPGARKAVGGSGGFQELAVPSTSLIGVGNILESARVAALGDSGGDGGHDDTPQRSGGHGSGSADAPERSAVESDGVGSAGEDRSVVDVEWSNSGESTKLASESKNARRRERNRARRARRRVASGIVAAGVVTHPGAHVPEWRVGAGPKSEEGPTGPRFEHSRGRGGPVPGSGAGSVESGGPTRGYFSDLSKEMQVQLKQTRAELLVAENRRKLAVEKSKLEQLQSPVAALERAMRALGFAERAAKKAGNSKVASWANEVVTSYAETVAKTVPSEEGSYESFVWSAATQSTSQSGVASEREQEYHRKVAALKDAYELMDVYFPEDLEQKLETLREEYGDVLYPGQQGLDVKACHDLIQMVDNSEWDLSVKVKLIELAEKKMEEAKKGFFDY